MSTSEIKRFVEMVLLILNKTGGVDAYHLYKILYFAELNHLAAHGAFLVPDDFRAKTHGPVPERLYKALKSLYTDDDQFTVELRKSIKRASEDADVIFIPNRKPDGSLISEEEKDAIEASINVNASLSFRELRKKSHDSAWLSTDRDHVISRLSMAKVVTDKPGLLAYIEETERIENKLRKRKPRNRKARTPEVEAEAHSLLMAVSGNTINKFEKWL